MSEWRTLKAEREYRGCLLRAGTVDGGFAWEVMVAPSLMAGAAAGLHTGRQMWPLAMLDGEGQPLRSIEDAQRAAVQACEQLARGLAGWSGAGGTKWEPAKRMDRSERDAWRANVGGLTARLVLTEYGMGVLSLGPSEYGAARSEAFRPNVGVDLRAEVDAMLRATAAAMGVADGDA